MTTVLAMKSPRCLAWVLLVAGGLDALLRGSVNVAVAVFANEPWGDGVGELFTLCLLGVLAAAAGIRILTGTR